MTMATPTPSTRRRRADAERSIGAILDAAILVFRQHSDASVEDIARAAGVSRQTVYAHFPSRQVLTAAVIKRVTDEIDAAMDAAGIDEGSAAEALVRLLDTTWQAIDRYPFLLQLDQEAMDASEERERHEPILDRLERLALRGQAGGEFERDLPASWLAAATVALGHAAGEEVSAGRMTAEVAAVVLRQSVLRVFGSAEAP
jgi:AcrR family transcriptional regulator